MNTKKESQRGNEFERTKKLLFALNSSNLERLGWTPNGMARTPLKVITGINPGKRILQVMRNDLSLCTLLTMELIPAAEIMNFERLQPDLTARHKDVQVCANIHRKKALEVHNKITNIVTHNFSTGYFVLFRRGTDRGHKLHVKWVGPSRIGVIHSPLVYGNQILDENLRRLSTALILSYTVIIMLRKETLDEKMKLANTADLRCKVVECTMNVG